MNEGDDLVRSRDEKRVECPCRYLILSRGVLYCFLHSSRNVWRPEMVRESESNSWAVSGLPSCKYSSTGALADMRLAIKRWIWIVSVSFGSMSRLSWSLLLKHGPRDFESFSTLSDVLECEPVCCEHILHRGSQSMCLGRTSFRPMPHLFHTGFLDGDDVL